MVSLDEVKKNFRSFVNEVSKKKGKVLNKDGLMNFSLQTRILAGLLEGKGFISQAEELDRIKRDVSKKGLVGEEDIRKLREILTKVL